MTADGRPGGKRWIAVMLVALVALGAVVAWVATRGNGEPNGTVSASAQTAPLPAKSAKESAIALPEVATAAVRPTPAKAAAGSAPEAQSGKPAGMPATTEQLRSRDFRRGTGLKQFADTAKLDLQRCMGKVYTGGNALVHVTFRRDSAAAAGGSDRFFPVSFGPAAGQISAPARKCMEGLRSVPLSIERGEVSEEEYLTVPMTLPLPGAP